MVFILLFLVSLAASIVGSISGIGGGVIIKPVMDSFGLFPVSTINFLTSCTVLSMTVATLFRSRNSGIVVEKRVSTILALGGIIGGYVGKELFRLLRALFDSEAIAGIFQYVLLTILTSWVLYFTIRKQYFTPRQYKGFFITICIGVLLGGIASFLGIGGGPINIAVLYLLFAMDSKTAALNSIFIIFFSQATNVFSTIALHQVPQFDIPVLLLMIAGGVSGGFIGPWISKKLTLRGVDMLFCAIMGIIILISIYNLAGFIGTLM